jgi:hypothetical protein
MGRAKGVHVPPSFHPESARQSGKRRHVHSTLFVIEVRGPSRRGGDERVSTSNPVRSFSTPMFSGSQRKLVSKLV